jgi:hypothetical protein
MVPLSSRPVTRTIPSLQKTVAEEMWIRLLQERAFLQVIAAEGLRHPARIELAHAGPVLRPFSIEGFRVGRIVEGLKAVALPAGE